MTTQKQLTLEDIFENCKKIFVSDKPQFLTLLENHIDLDSIVPMSFYQHYYASTGRHRKYPLRAILWALILQRIFSMPTSASSNHEVKQQYVNGHFCYAYKFGIMTNGLGIVCSIDFYNKDYLVSHPDVIIEKKSKSPDKDKSLADTKALIPNFKNFKERHSHITPYTFLGDTGFDTIEIYKSLFEDFNFKKAFIPLRVKLSLDNADYTFNEDGIPCCPHDSSLPMKREGIKSHLKSKLPTMKFVCPKMKWEYNREDKTKRRVCHCDNPCTTSSCGRMIYIYPEKNLRSYPDVERGSKEWNETYKIRVNVEKSINHFKDCFCVANPKNYKRENTSC